MLNEPDRQVDPAQLARWTPVAVDISGDAPMVQWADLSDERFSDPFFDQTVVRWATGPQPRPLIRTGFDVLAALDNEESLEPAGMIFHLSRCGSTLVSRLLGTVPGVVVIAEPAPLNSLLSLPPDHVDDATLVTMVRLLVRALGRCRHDDERAVVLKCTSWHIRRRAVLAAAFPDTPWIWVQRDPSSVLTSLLTTRPGWLKSLEIDPARAAWLMGLDPTEVGAMTRVEFGARVLGVMLESAAADPHGRLCVDYADLPTAVWEQVAAHFGLPVDAPAIERMTHEARLYSKDPAPRLFDTSSGGQAGAATGPVIAADRRHPRPPVDAIARATQRFAASQYRGLVACR